MNTWELRLDLYRLYAKDEAFNTNTVYCHYDEAHDDYLYQECWVDLIVKKIENGELSKEIWKQHFNKKSILEIKEFN